MPSQDDPSETEDIVVADIAPVGEEGHLVKTGECTSSIANATGHMLETLWNHPKNAELNAQRKDPRILRPDDKLFVPALRLSKEPAQTAQVNVFVRHGVPEHLFMQIIDHDDEPLSARPYRICIDGEDLPPAKTDDSGYIELDISPQAKEATLHIRVAPFDIPGLDLVDPKFLEQTLTIGIGRLEPIESPRGGAQRLLNLGYLDPTRLDAGEFLDAVVEFQAAHEITPEGEYDEPTQKALQKAHGT